MALLSVARVKYYGRNGAAARIWELLETPRTVASTCEALIAEFDVEPAECERDTRELTPR
jgi:Coenzyme PQQ synthesis protein D (PqqD)